MVTRIEVERWKRKRDIRRWNNYAINKWFWGFITASALWFISEIIEGYYGI